MALPTLQKTWQFNVNNQVAASGTVLTNNRALVRALKNSLIGFAMTPWTVRYSCNGTTAGSAGDGIDRWAADADLVWGAGAHSWIVLRQTGIGSTFEMLIALNNATSINMTIELSATGFTGGNTTTRPTASDSVQVHSGAWSVNLDQSQRWNVWQSTDGQCTRVALGHTGNFTFFLIVDRPNQPTVGWSTPYYSFASYLAAGMTTVPYITFSGALGRMRHSSTTGQVSFMVEGAGLNIITDTTVGNIANEIDSSWDMWPLGIACYTAGAKGRHGNAYDLWMVSNARASSDMMPGDGSNQFAVFKPFILPWNGSAAPAFA